MGRAAVTREEISAFFPFKWDCRPNLGATSYAVPTLAWLQGPCWDAFRQRYWNENLDKWVVRWECRDFARTFASFAQECWALTTGGTTDDGIAVGEIWFLPTPAVAGSQGHAVCPCITENGLQYIDPQTRQLWPMTNEQFDSRYFLRF